MSIFMCGDYNDSGELWKQQDFVEFPLGRFQMDFGWSPWIIGFNVRFNIVLQYDDRLYGCGDCNGGGRSMQNTSTEIGISNPSSHGASVVIMREYSAGAEADLVQVQWKIQDELLNNELVLQEKRAREHQRQMREAENLSLRQKAGGSWSVMPSRPRLSSMLLLVPKGSIIG
ncbi:hypothetical protein Ancab_005748 [Ancistrocladus abbreviatus]